MATGILPIVTPCDGIPPIIQHTLREVLAENPTLGTPYNYVISHQPGSGLTMGVGLTVRTKDGRAYRKYALVYDADKLNIFDAEEIAEIVRHELSHIKNGDVDENYDFLDRAINDFNRRALMWEQLKHVIGIASAKSMKMREHGTLNGYTQQKELRADITLCKSPAAAIRAHEKLIVIATSLGLVNAGTHPAAEERIQNLRALQERRMAAASVPQPIPTKPRSGIVPLLIRMAKKAFPSK
jgi:hypothetical protein